MKACCAAPSCANDGVGREVSPGGGKWPILRWGYYEHEERRAE